MDNGQTQPQAYTVKEGDTLESIAALYGLPDVNLLSEANGIADINEPLVADRILSIPVAAQPAAEEPTAPVEEEAKTEETAEEPTEDRSMYNCGACGGQGINLETNVICPVCQGTGGK